MPKNHTLALGQRDFDEAAPAGTARALAGVGPVGGAVAGADQPLAGDEKSAEAARHWKAALATTAVREGWSVERGVSVMAP